MSHAYYNEIDPYAAQWLRNLIAAGHIAAGDVDERSIVDLRPDDLRGYTQCHFFAGVGGWSLALRLAGWPDGRPVWTGSCPCQPFSAAGAGKAGDDERHLWPAWFSLIAECGPPVVFGEQVEAAIGWGWLDLVFADLEAKGYACGASVLPACGVGAPHIRQRLWFVANDAKRRRGQGRSDGGGGQQRSGRDEAARTLAAWPTPQAKEQMETSEAKVTRGAHAGLNLAVAAKSASWPTPTVHDAERGGQAKRAAGMNRHGSNLQDFALIVGDPESDGERESRLAEASERCAGAAGGSGPLGRELGDADNEGSQGWSVPRSDTGGGNSSERAPGTPGNPHGQWADIEWLACTDGKARPTQPGIFPLAHGVSGRVGRLRAYGNAIVPQVAAQFIIAADEAMRDE